MGTTAVEGLATAVRGRVVERGTSDYDEARSLYNSMIDKHPAAIAYCVDENDVAAAIAFARERGLRLAIRGGGHNGGGLGSVDDGLVIDLSIMNEISVDPEARMVRVQGGALLGQLDTATHEHGGAVPAGVISTTGLGGLTLRRGIGHLTRAFGLTSDSLVSATGVLAGGSVLPAHPEQAPARRWPLPGGGPETRQRGAGVRHGRGKREAAVTVAEPEAERQCQHEPDAEGCERELDVLARLREKQ